MAVKIRLARGGAKKRPYYRIVATDSRTPRDGRFLEKLGTYHPLLPSDDPKRVTLNEDRVKHWLDNGAKPSERVAIFLGQAGIAPMPAQPNRPSKSRPKKKAQERAAAEEGTPPKAEEPEKKTEEKAEEPEEKAEA